MKLYKFRSLDHLDYILDILLNERLHCSPYDELNDPFEGVFRSVAHIGALGTAPLNAFPLNGFDIRNTEMNVTNLGINFKSRVCSLSATMRDIRLWSYYADGHKGIAIEIELEDSEQLHQVKYRKNLVEFPRDLLGVAPTSVGLLETKTKHWKHEEEYRLITESDVYDVPGGIRAVYFGLRTPELMREALLRSIPNDIPVYVTRLNAEEVCVEVGSEVRPGAGSK